MKVRAWIIFSGIVWLFIGLMLLSKGIRLMAAHPNEILFMIALVVGFLKGRFVLSKTVHRIVKRMISLKEPIQWKNVYPRSYYFLILGMMGLGVLFRFLPISQSLHGAIDLAIGAALMNGAILYFRLSFTYDKSFPAQSL